MTLKKLLLLSFVLFTNPLFSMTPSPLKAILDHIYGPPKTEVEEILDHIYGPKMYAFEDLDKLTIEPRVIAQTTKVDKEQQELFFYVTGWKLSVPRLGKNLTILAENPSGPGVALCKKFTKEECDAFNKREMIEKIGIAMHSILGFQRCRQTTEDGLFRVFYPNCVAMDVLLCTLNRIHGTIDGQTALHFAAKWHLSCENLLRQKETNVFAKDKEGKLLIDLITDPHTRKLIEHRMKKDV